MTKRSFTDAFARLPADLPPGRLVPPNVCCRGGECSHPPVFWCSDEPVKDAATWWRRLEAQRAETGLFPVLLMFYEDVWYPGEGPLDDSAFDVTAYFQEEWER